MLTFAVSALTLISKQSVPLFSLLIQNLPSAIVFTTTFLNLILTDSGRCRILLYMPLSKLINYSVTVTSLLFLSHLTTSTSFMLDRTVWLNAHVLLSSLQSFVLLCQPRCTERVWCWHFYTACV